MLTLQRSNLDNNLDFNLKARLFEAGRESIPVMLGVVAGTAWNYNPPELTDGSTRAWQYYAQLTANVLFWERLALGVVPTYLHNPLIGEDQVENVFSVGIRR